MRMLDIAAPRAVRVIAPVLFAATAACHNMAEPHGGGGGGAQTSVAGKLVFARSDIGESVVIQVKPDGSAPSVINSTPRFAIPIGTAVSADGHHIAVEEQLINKTHIVLWDLSTGDTVPFPADQAHGYSAPSWSPSGSEIAFADDAGGPFPPEPVFGRVFVANADGSGARTVGDSAILGSAVTWSHDGTHVLYSRVGVLVSVMADGSTASPVPIGSADSVLDPAMSPDGTHIAFADGWPGGTVIVVMNADGSSPVQVSTPQVSDRHPNWSPDGTMLAFERSAYSVEASSAILVMGVTGSNLHSVSPAGTEFFDRWPSWGPAAP